MYVIKRDGREEKVHLDKITARIGKLCDGLDMRFIDPVSKKKNWLTKRFFQFELDFDLVFAINTALRQDF